MANKVLCLLSEWCPLLLYLGQLVWECNWAGEKNGTGSRAQEVLQLSLCLLRRLLHRSEVRTHHHVHIAVQ